VTAKFGLGTPEGVQGKVGKHSHSFSLSQFCRTMKGGAFLCPGGRFCQFFW
jgi:hypothetical protein